MIGASNVKYMALTALRMDTEAALRCGLIQKVVSAESVLDEAMAVATKIAGLAPISVLLTKQLINAASGEGALPAWRGWQGRLQPRRKMPKKGLPVSGNDVRPITRANSLIHGGKEKRQNLISAFQACRCRYPQRTGYFCCAPL